MGTVYRRGNVWWIQYRYRGKQLRESSESTRKRTATELLHSREGKISDGKYTGIKPEKVSLDELAVDLLNDYRINERKSLDAMEVYIRRLTGFFGRRVRAIHVTTDRIRAYIASRKEEMTAYGKPPANGAINRELSALKRMFSLGKEASKVIVIPHIPMLKENNVRKGFFHHRNYLRLKKVLPSYLKPIVTLAYFTGMRKGEILGLKWEQVDFSRRLIHLNPGETKNEEPRTVAMTGELLQELHLQRKLRDQKFPVCQYVFFNDNTGRAIKDFRGAWKSACKEVGLSSALFHDLRRTGVRNLVRAGVSDNVARRISGHKTRAVFDRYNITDIEDVKNAARAVEAYLKKSEEAIKEKVVEMDQVRTPTSKPATSEESSDTSEPEEAFGT